MALSVVEPVDACSVLAVAMSRAVEGPNLRGAYPVGLISEEATAVHVVREANRL